MSVYYRHTKIIFTLGPSCEQESVLREMIEEGVDICRINMAHATHEWTREVIRRIHSVSRSMNRPVGVMMDIKGPEIRIGDIDGTWDLKVGDRVRLACFPEGMSQNVRSVMVNYPGMVQDVQPGNRILVDNGLIQFQVEAVTEHAIDCSVLIPGVLKSRRHVNLPGVNVRLPAITEKDKADVRVGVEEGVNFFALSFTRKPEDVKELRAFLDSLGSQAHIISKLEDQSAIANLEGIVKESDGIMVARGDLGIECPYEQLPIIQRKIIRECLAQAKPVVVATHMLESMTYAPLPTRAEVSDVANAIFEQTDAIMLSGETSVGKYPVECIRTMKQIAFEVEKSCQFNYNESIELCTTRAKMGRAALILAQELGNVPILVFTRRGSLPQILSALRPTQCPIFAFTSNIHSYTKMGLFWGVKAFLIEPSEDPADNLQEALNTLKKEGYIESQTPIVTLTNVLINNELVYSLQVRNAG
jgi:pyruvate kinase